MLRRVSRPYFGNVTPFPFAHRGGAKRWPENTLVAFEGAAALGVRHIETDIHETADGHFVCFHDTTLERTTDGQGRIADFTLEELRKLDAGYRFERGGKREFRGRGVTIPTLEEALGLDPELHYNLEIKPNDPAMARRLWEWIAHQGTYDRVLVASEHDQVVAEFRELSKGRVATSPGFRGALGFWLRVLSCTAANGVFPFDALQIPPSYRGLDVVTPRFVQAAHAHGIQVHVWTIDDRKQMHRLLDAGVDALMTDLPEVLLEVLSER